MNALDRREQATRIIQMQTYTEKLRQDIRTDSRKFLVSAVLSAAALIGAGVGIGNLIWAHRDPAPPQVIILQMPHSST